MLVRWKLKGVVMDTIDPSMHVLIQRIRRVQTLACAAAGAHHEDAAWHVEIRRTNLLKNYGQYCWQAQRTWLV